MKPGRAYRYAVSFRTAPEMEGHGALLIDCYTAEGEKSHKALVSEKLAASPDWKALSGAMAQEGICRFLLSEDPRAAKLRRAFVFCIVPQMNPDGIAAGNLYCPVGNLNRQWGLGTAPETTAVERLARELTARGRKIELFMDFHGWCTPERTTLFMTYGKEITDAATERDALRLVETIKPRLSGRVSTTVWRKRVETVTGITSEVSRLAPGWMRFEAGARLAYSIEIFGEGECAQEQYWAWGRAFAEGIAEFHGL